ncbi:hypothetical protein PIB30_002707 [Stylosanthes scabra]|uniref:Uncharacterized protein n=1 Tax=Stylosanthes scabra TaxID=79078 RepID=A0ABU6R4D1_9FABA|nr:hypothetical protein [Stylosanthes scabra]
MRIADLVARQISTFTHVEPTWGNPKGSYLVRGAVRTTQRSSLRARSNSPTNDVTSQPYTPQPVPAKVLGDYTLGSSGSRLLGSSRNIGAVAGELGVFITP